MSSDKSFSLPVGEHLIHGVVRPAATPGRRPTVVLCHGFKGFMDWGFFPSLADLLSERGFCVVRFNFSGSGMRPGDELVSDPDAFRHATFSKDLTELEALIASIADIAPDIADPETIGVVAHSRGGGTAVLAAASEESPIRALVTWAAVSTFARLPEQAVEAWRGDGEIPIVNARTGQELALGIDVLEDLESQVKRLDITAAAQRRRAPWLIVHGHDDETVPFNEAIRLHAAARKPVELLAIEEADHTLGAKHPFSGPTPALIAAMNATQRWFRRYLTQPDSSASD